MRALSAAIDIGGHLAQCSDVTVGRGVTATAEALTVPNILGSMSFPPLVLCCSEAFSKNTSFKKRVSRALTISIFSTIASQSICGGWTAALSLTLSQRSHVNVGRGRVPQKAVRDV